MSATTEEREFRVFFYSKATQWMKVTETERSPMDNQRSSMRFTQQKRLATLVLLRGRSQRGLQSNDSIVLRSYGNNTCIIAYNQLIMYNTQQHTHTHTHHTRSYT